MVDKRVIDARLKKLDQCVVQLRELSTVPLNLYVEDLWMQAVVERYILVAIQVSLDIAKDIIVNQHLRVPDSEEKLFVRLSKADVIPTKLGNRLKETVCLGNSLLYDYLHTNARKVHQLLKTRIKDFEAFAQAITTYFEGGGSDQTE